MLYFSHQKVASPPEILKPKNPLLDLVKRYIPGRVLVLEKEGKQKV